MFFQLTEDMKITWGEVWAIGLVIEKLPTVPKLLLGCTCSMGSGIILQDKQSTSQ
jgi:hypothetical protein